MGNIKFIEPLCRHGYMVSNCIYCEEMAALRARVAVLEKVAEAAKEYDEARGLFHEADWKGMIESNNELFNECEMDRGIDPFYKVRAALDALKEG